MSTEDQFDGLIHQVGEGGMAAAHPIRPADADALVAPVSAAERNTFRLFLLPKACWRLEDLRFAFDSSFLLPEAALEMPLLRSLIKQHTEEGVTPPLSIFGHADPVGNDDYNKALSGRRATVIYGALTRRADLWEDIYSHPAGGDKWGMANVQVMLAAANHDPGRSDGVMDKPAQDAAKAFQTEQGLVADGVVGPKTREKLFLAYMDVLCGPDFTLAKEDFLARGLDEGGKGDFQGCSEFNPLLLFSQAENAALSRPERKGERDDENAPNRRVMVFLFRPGRQVDPARWPCPRAKEGVAACRKRFFSDGEQRRAFGPVRREFDKTKDTFACRFYHRLATDSPCERPLPPSLGLGFLSVQIFFHQEPLADLAVRFSKIDGGEPLGGGGDGEPLNTDADGVVTFGRPVPLGNYVCQIEEQPPKIVCTVESPEEPFLLVLPVGRPYFDFEGDVEFVSEETG